MRTVRTVMKTLANRLGSAPRSSLHLAAAVFVIGLAVVGVFPPRPGFVIALSLAILGGCRLVGEVRADVARRREADRLLVALETDRVPDGLRWRAAELTRARERKALARALRNLLRSLELPPAMFPTLVNRRALRRNRSAVEALANRLAAVDRPVRPRGILLLRQLLGGSPHSPLYDVEAAGDLHAVLARVRSEIEPR